MLISSFQLALVFYPGRKRTANKRRNLFSRIFRKKKSSSWKFGCLPPVSPQWVKQAGGNPRPPKNPNQSEKWT